jgi:hypothetical protein
MASIRMMNIQHIELGTHGGQHDEAQVDPLVVPKNILIVDFT